jgi:uncharacterized membrane protein YoaT (DUF817 family)
MQFYKELWAFGMKQILNCIFPAYIFLMLALSHLQPWIPRYDFLLIMCILAQVLLFFLKYETWDDLKVISAFHIIGLVMEIYKVHVGSWSYPESAYSKIAGVPLYSGFMYAAVSSYMLAAWERFSLKFMNWPSPWITFSIAFLIYLNFFTNHFIWDFRYLIGLGVLIIFARSRVYFINIREYRSMPVIISFILIAFFIWLGENIATLLGAWKYSYQHSTWQMVRWHKMSSWVFMVMICYFLIAVYKKVHVDKISKMPCQ